MHNSLDLSLHYLPLRWYVSCQSIRFASGGRFVACLAWRFNGNLPQQHRIGVIISPSFLSGLFVQDTSYVLVAKGCGSRTLQAILSFGIIHIQEFLNAPYAVVSLYKRRSFFLEGSILKGGQLSIFFKGFKVWFLFILIWERKDPRQRWLITDTMGHQKQTSRNAQTRILTQFKLCQAVKSLVPFSVRLR